MEPNVILVDHNDSASSMFASSSSPPSPALQPPPQVAQQMLANISSLLLQQTQRLNEIRIQQAQYLIHPLANMYNVLVQLQTILHAQISEQLQVLSSLEQQIMLLPLEIGVVRQLKQDLHLQLRQLEVYQEELKQCQQTQLVQPLIALAICKQPFPMVVRKGKQFNDDLLAAQVLTGAYVHALSIEALPPITATLLLDNSSAAGGPSLEFNVQKVDSNGVASFPLKFLVGTRKSVVHIKFGMSLSPNTSIPPIESEMSNPAIIITNECQWEGSLGMLMKRDAFGGKLEISWALFANTLQHYFLIATKQDPRKPKRALSTFDFSYLHARFFNNRSTIKQPEFDAFWVWFGKIIHLVRFQKHVCGLYLDGLIYGLMNREHTQAILENRQPIGTFIIRFSERHPGQLDIAYIDVNSTPSHYLVKHSDISGPTKFPDFLAEKPKLLYLLQLTTDPQGQPMFLHLEKGAALQPYVAPKPPVRNEDEEGYVQKF